MNLSEEKYKKYALVREMMETPGIVKGFDPRTAERFVSPVKSARAGLFFTGEGSSRIFPAKRALYAALKNDVGLALATDGATQALEYDLSDFAVFGASNSGQTKEVVRLFLKLKESGHEKCFGLTANNNTKLEEIAKDTHVLGCGKEDAVAATKSVVEQGLFYDSLLRNISGTREMELSQLAGDIEKALTLSIPDEMIGVMKNADMIYFAGRNTGVAEELTLKTNEITRKKSDFLEGTYAVHGIEEVMDSNEAVVIIEPFEEEEEMFKKCLLEGVGMNVFAISSRETIFPTIRIPENPDYQEYVELAAGWNLLVEIGLSLGIDLDKPVRARKVGNEYLTKE